MTAPHLPHVRASLRASLAVSAAMLPLAALTTPALAVDAPAASHPSVAAAAPANSINGLDPRTIDANARGALTIHAVHTTTTSTGQVVRTPVPNVTFQVSRVGGIDLSTASGWERAFEYYADPAAARANLGPAVVSDRPDTEGNVTVSDLPVGLYYVHAVTQPGANDLETVDFSDFLITVPMVSGGEDTHWLYAVDAYPKSSATGIIKTVTDSGALRPGAVLTYRLDATISSADPAANAGYRIIDDLGASVVPGRTPTMHTSDYLTYLDGSWRSPVSVATTGTAGHALTACTTAAATSCDYTLELSGSRVQATMTAQGAAALAAAKTADSSATVQIALQAKVRATVDAATTGAALALPNTAQLVAHTGATPVGSNTVRTVYAPLRLHKVDATNKGNLAGAVFALYATEADALARRNVIATSAATNSAGLTSVTGLHVNDITDDQPSSTSYWAVETTAPTGYTALDKPFRVKVLSDGSTVGADGSGGVPVLNHRAPSGVLALTGSDAAMLGSIALVLTGAGGAFLLAGRRRREREDI